ncbi:hypothetical protein ZHAS_00002593 [Anopheles sinensis]|uniref:Uncharacterized protein n=1 Tax=Anopheles sinensis TaxID=74873 RepID=A0A084VCK2_ANOSI|nr:hypothetical protein ZHAS_00002593 [Anopheles sinensis]
MQPARQRSDGSGRGAHQVQPHATGKLDRCPTCTAMDARATKRGGGESRGNNHTRGQRTLNRTLRSVIASATVWKPARSTVGKRLHAHGLPAAGCSKRARVFRIFRPRHDDGTSVHAQRFACSSGRKSSCRAKENGTNGVVHSLF